MRYTASTEAMQEYSQIIQTIARVDLETERLQGIRTEAVQRLQAWEQAHQVDENAPAEEEEQADCLPPQ